MTEVSPVIRQITIDMITDTPNPILVWFNDLWAKLNIIETDVYQTDGGELIYYIIEDDKKIPIFYQDIKNVRFWCDYNHYWQILNNKFDIDYNDTTYITKLLVENALKYSITTPVDDVFYENGRVMNALNQFSLT